MRRVSHDHACVDRLTALAPPPRAKRLHHLGQALAPLLGGPVVMIDPDDGELVRKLAGFTRL